MGDIEEKKPRTLYKRRLSVKLIFNPDSGVVGESPVKLMDVISAMQELNLVPEPYLVKPDSDLINLTRETLEDGIRMFVVCGGDGTINVVARALVGKNATLGIIPTGTQNNIALSLGIPNDIPAAIKILRTGRRIKMDMGLVTSGKFKQSFLEICTVGLFSALYSAADDIQHGNLTRIGDFLATLVTSPAAETQLILDGKKEIKTMCHVVLVSNMPFIGPHLQISNSVSFTDGLLDVLLFTDMSKINLLGYVFQAARAGGKLEDERIQHYKVSRVEINTIPAMPVMADGMVLGEGKLHITIQRHSLAVIVGREDQLELPAR